MTLVSNRENLHTDLPFFDEGGCNHTTFSISKHATYSYYLVAQSRTHKFHIRTAEHRPRMLWLLVFTITSSSRYKGFAERPFLVSNQSPLGKKINASDHGSSKGAKGNGDQIHIHSYKKDSTKSTSSQPRC